MLSRTRELPQAGTEMNRIPNSLLAVTSICTGLVMTAPARAATLTEVTADWKGGVNLPSYVKFFIYVPDSKASKPPILVSSHSCGSTASGQMGAIPKIKAAADKYGFILVLPDNPGQNCWDVGSDKSLKHDNAGDTHAVAQMVRYTLSKYNGDASRVYAMGGSSGGMMTQALMAVYPDLFRAGSARAGVPAGCWAVEYDKGGTRQWSNPCANGQVAHTPEEWGKIVLDMFSSYAGHRPRIQLMQGGSDTTISSNNMQESIDEWTNVLGLSATPTSKDSITTSIATYNRQFWENSCKYVVLESWVAPGKDHSMSYEEDAILKFFGLDTATTADPEPDCTGGVAVPGAGGASSVGSGGASSVGSGGASSVGSGGASSVGSGGAGSVGSGGTRSVVTGGAANSVGGSVNPGGTSSVATKSTGGTASTSTSSSKGGANASSSTTKGSPVGGSVATGASQAFGGMTANTGSLSLGGAPAANGGSSSTTGGSRVASSVLATGGNSATSSVSTGGSSTSAVASTAVQSGPDIPAPDGGCGCRVEDRTSRSGALFGASLIGLLLLRSRRRRSAL
jgi:poly(hydroxyalkanoate) depolymerase family esterase